MVSRDESCVTLGLSRSNVNVSKCFKRNETFINPLCAQGFGRRTGVALKACVRKDNNGFEDFDDYFSDTDEAQSDISEVSVKDISSLVGSKLSVTKTATSQPKESSASKNITSPNKKEVAQRPSDSIVETPNKIDAQESEINGSLTKLNSTYSPQIQSDTKKRLDFSKFIEVEAEEEGSVSNRSENNSNEAVSTSEVNTQYSSRRRQFSKPNSNECSSSAPSPQLVTSKERDENGEHEALKDVSDKDANLKSVHVILEEGHAPGTSKVSDAVTLAQDERSESEDKGLLLQNDSANRNVESKRKPIKNSERIEKPKSFSFDAHRTEASRRTDGYENHASDSNKDIGVFPANVAADGTQASLSASQQDAKVSDTLEKSVKRKPFKKRMKKTSTFEDDVVETFGEDLIILTKNVLKSEKQRKSEISRMFKENDAEVNDAQKVTGTENTSEFVRDVKDHSIKVKNRKKSGKENHADITNQKRKLRSMKSSQSDVHTEHFELSEVPVRKQPGKRGSVQKKMGKQKKKEKISLISQLNTQKQKGKMSKQKQITVDKVKSAAITSVISSGPVKRKSRSRISYISSEVQDDDDLDKLKLAQSEPSAVLQDEHEIVMEETNLPSVSRRQSVVRVSPRNVDSAESLTEGKSQRIADNTVIATKGVSPRSLNSTEVSKKNSVKARNATTPSSTKKKTRGNTAADMDDSHSLSEMERSKDEYNEEEMKHSPSCVLETLNEDRVAVATSPNPVSNGNEDKKGSAHSEKKDHTALNRNGNGKKGGNKRKGSRAQKQKMSVNPGTDEVLDKGEKADLSPPFVTSEGKVTPKSILKNSSEVTQRNVRKRTLQLDDAVPALKAVIIKPPETSYPEKRPRRNRVRPLEFWRNEKPVYERRKSGGFALTGIIAPDENPSPYKKGKRTRERKAKKTVNCVPVTPRNMSPQCDPPSDAEQEVPLEVVVVNPDTQREVLVNAIKTSDNINYVNPSGKPWKKGDSIAIAKAIIQPAFSLGFLKINPFQEKGIQLVQRDMMMFYVCHGKLAVKIHKTSVILQSGDTFFVPKGNVYNIKNLRDEVAKVVFFQLKGD